MKYYDPDVIAAHDLYDDQLELIMCRAEKIKATQNISWLGRLKKLRLGYGKISFNMQKARLITKGRLLVDTYKGAKELVRENDYELGILSEKYL